MIEQGMIFALGVLVASLLSLLFLPVLSRRAVRLATRRLQMLVPLSPAEIVAERDQIRAGHAVEVRRFEQSVEALERRRADLMADNGRLVTRVMALDAANDDLGGRNATLAAALEAATRDANEARAELGLQMQLLHDTLGVAERRLAILRTAQASLAAADAQADERRATIAGLETRTTGQDLRVRTLMAQLATAAADLKEARDRIVALMAERDAAVADLETERERLQEAERHAADDAMARADLAHRAAQADDALAALRVAPAGDPTSIDPQVLREAVVALGDRLLRFATEARPMGPDTVADTPEAEPATTAREPQRAAPV